MSGLAIRAAYLTPVLKCGGTEWWFHALAKYSDARRVQWRLGLTDPANRDSAVERTIDRVAPVHHGRVGVEHLLGISDVVVAWGLPDLPDLLRGWKGPVVLVSQGCCDWNRSWIRAASPVATHRVAISRAAAEAFGADDVTVIHTGADPDRCRATRPRDEVRAEWGLRPDEVAVGCVGRLSAEKGCVGVAAAVRELGPPHRGVFVGRDEFGDVTRDVLEALPDAILVPRLLQVGDAYAALDCLAMASPAEGGPLVALEAMRAGLPLAATPVGILPEVLAAGGRFAVISDRSAAGVAAAIRLALAETGACLPDAFIAAAMAERWTTELGSSVGLLPQAGTSS